MPLLNPIVNPRIRALFAALMPIFLSACVTVNVNFPESAVQSAADNYVRDIYRAKEKDKTPDTNPSPSATPEKKPKTSGFFHFDNLIPEAVAQTVFKVDSPKALKIRDRLRQRVEDVLEQKKAGVLGESNDGLLVLKAPEKLKKLFLKKIETLVAEENSDREDLYKEVLSINQMARNRLKDVQNSFSRSFQSESPSGTWIQTEDGKWAQKP